jgi:hypothetical protein
MAVIEVCTFAVSADDDEVRAADARLQTEFAYRQPGLLRRTTARGADGRWCVITLWRDEADASQAAANAETDEVAAAFWSVVDAGSVDIQRFTMLE